LSKAREIGSRLNGQTIQMAMKTGEAGRLYGAVTAMDVAAALDKAGFKIDKRDIILSQTIKSLGHFEAEIKLHHEVTVKIGLEVVALH